MSAQKNIVILGGSYGGVGTAHSLLKHVIPALPNKSSYVVTIVSPSTHFMVRPAAPRALVNDKLLPYDQIFVEIAPHFKQYPAENFRFVHAAATKLEHEGRKVTVQLVGSKEEQVLEYHALVIATGGRTLSPLHGLYGDHKQTLEAWAAFQAALPKAKSILIAGGGPTGVETAGELAEFLNSKGKPKVEITLVNATDKLLPVLRDAIVARAETQLKNLGVKIIKGKKVVAVEPANAGLRDQVTGSLDAVTAPVKVTIGEGADVKTISADLYIPAFGFRPNTDFVERTLLDERGFVKVDVPTLRVTEAGPRVYAIGDASASPRPAVHNITHAVPVLATNIKRDLLAAAEGKDQGPGDDKIFEPDLGETQLVPIGRKGVGAFGGWRMPSFFVWLIKGRHYWLDMVSGFYNGKDWAKAL